MPTLSFVTVSLSRARLPHFSLLTIVFRVRVYTKYDCPANAAAS